MFLCEHSWSDRSQQPEAKCHRHSQCVATLMIRDSLLKKMFLKGNWTGPISILQCQQRWFVSMQTQHPYPDSIYVANPSIWARPPRHRYVNTHPLMSSSVPASVTHWITCKYWPKRNLSYPTVCYIEAGHQNQQNGGKNQLERFTYNSCKLSHWITLSNRKVIKNTQVCWKCLQLTTLIRF